MKKEIEINGKTYSTLAWLNIFTGSRSVARYQDTIDEIMEVFEATDEEAKKIVDEYMDLKGKL